MYDRWPSASDPLDICEVAFGLWTIEKLFYGATSYITHFFSRMGIIGFSECQMNICYPSASFQPSNSVVLVNLFRLFFVVDWNICMLHLLNWTPMHTLTFSAIRYFIIYFDFIELTDVSSRPTTLSVVFQLLSSCDIKIRILNDFHGLIGVPI